MDSVSHSSHRHCGPKPYSFRFLRSFDSSSFCCAGRACMLESALAKVERSAMADFMAFEFWYCLSKLRRRITHTVPICLPSSAI